MTAHNSSLVFRVDDRACAVIDRAYNYSVALRTAFLFVDFFQAILGNQQDSICLQARLQGQGVESA
jgi:hypothetical protein